MRKVILGTVALFFLLIISTAAWLSLYEPTPIDELLPSDARIELADYDGSMPPGAGSPDVMILGTSHLAQMEHRYEQSEFDEVRRSLVDYAPDMVVVEYLPPDYPRGKGRDYRPSFDLDDYAAKWDMQPREADSLLSVYRANEYVPDDPCRLGKAFFLQYDLVNAPYLWFSNDCSEVERYEEINNWLDRRREHEMAEIGYPVAREQNIRELVSFDYQGDDAEWFIHDKFLDLLYDLRLGAAAQFWPVLPDVGITGRERRGRIDESNLISMLRDSNSPEHIGLQYWAYEEIYRGIEWENVGDRQVDNYWLRNERMFQYLKDAIEEEQPDRVLVIVGSGHKYFLDELTRKAGYRWIDPLEWLPPRPDDSS